MNLWQLSVRDLASGYRVGRYSPLEVVDELLTRIDRSDSQISAFRQVLADSARSEATRMTEELSRGQTRGPLHGVPVAVKELIDVEGADISFGSQVFATRVAEQDAGAVARIRDAGAIILGISRSHEFGWGITTQHPHFGGTRNPWDLSRVPGGSSGGSAAALAAGMVPLALGTDTGGSIRIPAAFCGVAGIKPTYGRVSKRGVVPLAPSLDHVGPLARTVDDLSLAMEVLAGYDPQDPSTGHHPLPDLSPETHTRLDGITVALAPSLHLYPLAPDYETVFTVARTVISDAGAELVEVDVPHAEQICDSYTVLQMAEAYHSHSAVLRTYPSRAPDYGTDVRERLEAATHVGVGDYLEARAHAQEIRRDFEEVFNNVDVILTPASAGPPSTIEDPDHTMHLGRAIPFRELVLGYTAPQNVLGLPSCVVPAGHDDGRRPVAVQVTGPRYREDIVLRVAATIHRRLGAEKWWAPELEDSPIDSEGTP